MSGFVQGTLAIIRFDGFAIGPTEANNEGEEKIRPPPRAGGDLPLGRRGEISAAEPSLFPAASTVIPAQQQEEPGLRLAGLPAGAWGLRPLGI